MISITCLMSCSSSDDTPEPTPVPTPTEPTKPVETGTPITFYGQETEAQDVSQGVKRANLATRAGTPLSELATSFKVWGYKNQSESGGSYDGLQEVFPGYTVNWQANSAATTTTNSSGWEYVAQQTGSEPEQTIKYWDWSAKAYRFFACAEVAGGGTVTVGKTDGHTDRFTMNVNCCDDDGDENLEEDEVIKDNMEATPYFSRLWFSTGVLPDYIDKQFGKPVRLEFLKPYARVRFMFTYSYQSEGIKLKKKEFKPTTVGDKIVRKGTFTVSYPLTGTGTSETYSMTPATGEGSGALEAFTQEYIPDGGPEREKWYFVAPNNTQGSYTLSVWLNNDPLDAAATKTAVVPAEYMQWLPGYSYTYIFKILEEGGVKIELVQSAVTPWTDMNTTYTVYNW